MPEGRRVSGHHPGAPEAQDDREPVRPGDRLVIAVERVRVRPKAMIVCRFQGLVRESIVVDGVIKGVPLPIELLAQVDKATT